MTDQQAWMRPAELARRLGRAGAPTVIDVRRREAFERSDRMVAAARWRDHRMALDWADELTPGQDVVVYCVHGHQVSQSAAALLATRGVNVRTLRGGIEAYRETGGTCVARSPGLQDGPSPSQWVTEQRPTVDALGAAWLIRRFVDPDARLLFAAAEQVHAVAGEIGATAYGVAGCLSGQSGGGEGFEALLHRFAIDDPTLRRLARIVRGAHDGPEQLTPQSAGLQSLCVGLLQLHDEDLAAHAGAMHLFDALYAWARSAPAPPR